MSKSSLREGLPAISSRMSAGYFQEGPADYFLQGVGLLRSVGDHSATSTRRPVCHSPVLLLPVEFCPFTGPALSVSPVPSPQSEPKPGSSPQSRSRPDTSPQSKSSPGLSLQCDSSPMPMPQSWSPLLFCVVLINLVLHSSLPCPLSPVHTPSPWHNPSLTLVKLWSSPDLTWSSPGLTLV